MALEIGFTDELVNTQFAPVAALRVLYQSEHTLQPLASVLSGRKKRLFSPDSLLIQVVLSLLTGCDTLSEVNPRLKPEVPLAQAWGWPHFADQSTLSRVLDGLSLKQLDRLRTATTHIWRSHSRTLQHDWRGYLWLDYDFSGLPCSAQAEASQKGYFAREKTRPGGS